VHEVVAVPVDAGRARVYEHGWQSWSPTAAHRLADRPPRPVDEVRRVMNYRPDTRAPADAFWGEGLLAVDPGTGEGVHVVGAPSPAGPIPSIRADVRGGQVVVRADGPVEHAVLPGGLDAALGGWGEAFAARAGVGPLRPAPTLWCSWYHYYTRVTEADVEENLLALAELDLDLDVVQIDDGYQAEIGDWLLPSHRFASLPDLVARIRDRGRRAGIWTAPFLVGARSELAGRHPEWTCGEAGHGWDQPLAALDVTRPGVEAYLREVFGTFRSWGVDFFKVDFVYAGALPGLDAYRHGLRVIREVIGPESFLLGCGAPILASVGLVDAMRVGPDISHHWEPETGDMSQPGQRTAASNVRWRAWQHGRFWVNDPDCLVVAPQVERRAEWAATVERYGGLRASGDRLRGLDAWGLATTRRLVGPVPATPFGA
jgi:alpha-galactosidase